MKGADRTAILHVDDLGASHAANRAFLDLAGRGLVDCGSVMAPCPWFREIAEAGAIAPDHAGWRLAERDLLASGAAASMLARAGVGTSGYRALNQAFQSAGAAAMSVG